MPMSEKKIKEDHVIEGRRGVRYSTSAALCAAWYAGDISRLEVVAAVRSLVTPETVDDVMQHIPAECMPLLAEMARAWCSGDALVSIGQGPPLPEHPQATELICGWMNRAGKGV